MKAKTKTRNRRQRAIVLTLRFTGVQADKLAKIGATYWGWQNRGMRKAVQQAFVVERLVTFALRDVDRTLATYGAFIAYCESEGFRGLPARRELLDRQIEQAWARSRAAKQLRGVR